MRPAIRTLLKAAAILEEAIAKGYVEGIKAYFSRYPAN